MIDRKYLTEYSDLMLKSSDSFSGDTMVKLADTITSVEHLRKVEQILSTNPTEQQLLQQLDRLKN